MTFFAFGTFDLTSRLIVDVVRSGPFGVRPALSSPTEIPPLLGTYNSPLT